MPLARRSTELSTSYHAPVGITVRTDRRREHVVGGGLVVPAASLPEGLHLKRVWHPGLVALSLVPSCSEEGVVVSAQETEHFEISSEARVCRGTLELIERVAGEAALLHGAPVVDVTVPLALGEQAVEVNCADQALEFQAGGCAQGDGVDTRVYTTMGLVLHEVVHAVRRRDGVRGPAFLEEGLAELASGSAGREYGVAFDAAGWTGSLEDIAAAEGPIAFEELYLVAPHLFAWMTSLDAGALEAISSPGLGVDDLGAVMGLTMEELEDSWRGSSEGVYWRGRPCDGTALPELGSVAAVDYSTQVLCSEVGSYGSPGQEFGVRHKVCFDIAVAGSYGITNQSDAGTLSLRLDERIPCASGGELEAIQSRVLPPGASSSGPLAPCSWIAEFQSEHDDYRAALQITPNR